MYKYLNIYTQYGMENSRKGKYPARGNPIQKHIYSPNSSLSMQPHTRTHTHWGSWHWVTVPVAETMEVHISQNTHLAESSKHTHTHTNSPILQAYRCVKQHRHLQQSATEGSKITLW